MKKIVGLALALVLMLAAVCAPAEEEIVPVEYKTELTEDFGMTAEEWLADDMNRALLSTCLTADLAMGNQVEAVTMESVLNSYAGVDKKGVVTVLMIKETEPKNTFIITYEPGTGVCTLEELGELVSKLKAQEIMDDRCKTFEKNDLISLGVVTKIFEEAAAEVHAE